MSGVDASWDGIDPLLLAGRVLPAVESLRAGGTDLRTALEMISQRIEHLKATRSSEFTVPVESVGKDIYT